MGRDGKPQHHHPVVCAGGCGTELFAGNANKKCETCKSPKRPFGKDKVAPISWNKDPHERSMMTRYGLSLERYHQILAQQEGRCIFCNSTKVVVDHDHKTGKVRGLLCRPHNAAIGMLGDTEGSLMKVLDYLRGSDG